MAEPQSDESTSDESNSDELRVRFSLRWMLVLLGVLGAGAGLLGRLFITDPQTFIQVFMTLITVGPFLLAIGTLVWIGFRVKTRSIAVWAGVLALTPVLGYFVLGVIQSMGGSAPQGLGLLSTRRILKERLPNQIDEPWVWRELQRRLTAGRLSAAEVDDAVGQLTAFMKKNKPGGWGRPLSWQDDFLEAAAPKIGKQNKIALADAYYGKPTVNTPRLPPDAREFHAQFKFGGWSGDSGLPVKLLWRITQVRINGTPVKYQVGTGPSTTRSMLVNLDALSPQLPPGNATMEVDVVCAYVPVKSLAGVNPRNLLVKNWPTPVHKWTEKLRHQVTVLPANVPLVNLITDPPRDPSRSITAQRVVIRQHDERKRVTLDGLMIDRSLPVAVSFDIIAVVDGRELSLGYIVRGAKRGSGSGTRSNVFLKQLPPNVTSGKLILRPNVKHLENAVIRATFDEPITEIWGKPIEFDKIPIERLDLEDSGQ